MEITLHQLKVILRDAMDTKGKPLGVFLSVEGAFGNSSNTKIRDLIRKLISGGSMRHKQICLLQNPEKL